MLGNNLPDEPMDASSRTNRWGSELPDVPAGPLLLKELREIQQAEVTIQLVQNKDTGALRDPTPDEGKNTGKLLGNVTAGNNMVIQFSDTRTNQDTLTTNPVTKITLMDNDSCWVEVKGGLVYQIRSDSIRSGQEETARRIADITGGGGSVPESLVQAA